MVISTFPSSLPRWFTASAVVCLLALALCGRAAQAVETEFVGALALLAEEDIAEELALTGEQKEAALKLIDDRELEALELALALKDKTADERETQLAPFRSESQQQGLGILTSKQRAKFAGIIVRKLGAEQLREPALAEAIGLTAEQRQKLAEEIARQQSPDNPSTDKEAMQLALLDLLTVEQRGLITPAAGPSQPEVSQDGEANPTTARMSDRPSGEQFPGGTSLPVEPRATERKIVAAPPAVRPVPKDGKLYFNFRYQPWKDVLDWFAEQASLSLTLNEVPEGTFNYADARGYTPAEALDVLNSVLLTKGYTLVQHERLLMLANIADGIPANLVPNVALEELDNRGQHELVSVLFPLRKMTAAEAESEVKKLLGPQGSLITLTKAQQIQVTETAGRLRTIRRVIEAIEGPADGDGRLKQFTLKHISTAEALPIVRRLLNLPDETDAASDGSLRLAVDLSGRTLLATGKEHRLAQLAEVLDTLDQPGEDEGLDFGPLETPQLEVYTVPASDPTSVLQVLQTLLAGQSDVRLALDPKTGNLIALARPSQHATIQATIAQMQRDGRRIEAFALQVVDPQAAVLAVNKLFGVSGEGPTPASAPTVDADPISRTLLVRASDAQLQQIKSLLEKMGETGEGPIRSMESRGNVRVLPLTGRTFRTALDQMEQIWPTVRGNKIRVVAPSASGAVRGIPDFTTPAFAPRDPREDIRSRERGNSPDSPSPEDREPADALPGGSVLPAEPPPASDRSTDTPRMRPGGVPARFASDVVEPPGVQSIEPRLAPAQPADDSLIAPEQPTLADRQQAEEPLPEILVAPGPNGILIASDDLEALDEFEELLTAMASRSASGREFAVFYLKHAKAIQVAETLKQIFGGGSGGGDGGSLMGDLAGAALGDLGGGLLGSLLGGGGGDSGFSGSVGAIDIVPDVRLNALITRGKPADLDTLEQLLSILDQVDSPEEVLASPKPRLIPVLYSSAEEVANVVRQVYSDRMAGGANAAQQRPSPQDFIRALRGGRERGGSQGATDEPSRMTIGVDSRSNSLIVAAPQALFVEVEMLVKQLDQDNAESGETTRVVTLKRSNPQAVSRALTSVLGPAVQSNTTSTTNATTTSGSPSQSGRVSGGQSQGPPRQQNTPAADPAAEFQQRLEFMNRMREQLGGSRGRSSRGGGR